MTRISYRCPRCGGADVGKDGIVFWDDDTQEFSNPSTYDQNLCNNCGEVSAFDEVELPPEAPQAKKIVMLDLSTAHLTQEVCERISSQVATLPMAVKSDEYGFFMSSHPAKDEAVLASLPQCLQDCLKRALAEDCQYILFDRDSAILDDLPSYEW